MPRLLRTPLRTSKFVEHSFNFMLLSKRGRNLLSFYGGYSWLLTQVCMGVSFIHANETFKQNISMRKKLRDRKRAAGAKIPTRPIDAAICGTLSYSVLERERLLAPSVVRGMDVALQSPNEDCRGTLDFVQPCVLLIFCSTSSSNYKSNTCICR